MKNIIRFILLYSFTLIAFLIVHAYEQHEVFAGSPSFPIQQVFDDQLDWNIPDPNSTERNIFPEIAEDPFDCVTDLYVPSDITSVSYSSDGKYLNATLWLYSPLEDPAYNIISREYAIQIDVASVYESGSADYASAVSWNNNTSSWTKELYEYNIYADDWRYIKSIPNYTGFFQKGKNYVTLYFDLQSMNLPDQYKLIFVAQDTFVKDGIYCKLLDITDFFPVPAPKYNISVTQNSLFIKPGQEKTIELKIESEANFPSVSNLYWNQTKGLEMQITPSELSLPPKGITTSLIHIKALENATVAPYTLSISSSIYPNETLYSGFTELKGNLPHEILKRNTALTVVVEEPLGILDYVNNVLSTWGAPVREFFAIVTTIGGAGVSGWIINKIRHKIKRKNEQKKEDNAI
jgi:hypothetical protein